MASVSFHIESGVKIMELYDKEQANKEIDNAMKVFSGTETEKILSKLKDNLDTYCQVGWWFEFPRESVPTYECSNCRNIIRGEASDTCPVCHRIMKMPKRIGY